MSVIKKDTSETKTVGKVYLSSLTNVRFAPPSSIYLTTRSSKQAEYALAQGWEYCPELGPSWDLFNRVKAFKEANRWNQIMFDDMYKQQFISDLMSNRVALLEIKKLIRKLNNGDNITLVCYCTNQEICHRSILGEIMNKACNAEIIKVEKVD